MPGFDRTMLTLTGAYGRKATMSDWLAGKDFKIAFGPYCSIRDCKTMADQGTTMLVFKNSPNEYQHVFYVTTDNPTVINE